MLTGEIDAYLLYKEHLAVSEGAIESTIQDTASPGESGYAD